MDSLGQSIADKDKIIQERDDTIATILATNAALKKRLNESMYG